MSKKIKSAIAEKMVHAPYTFIIRQDFEAPDKSYYVISVKELPGVCTDASSLVQAFEEIKEAMLLAFEMYEEAGEPIPVPCPKPRIAKNC